MNVGRASRRVAAGALVLPLLVALALPALADEQGDMHRARSLLEQSIGARPHLGGRDVPPIREASSLGSGTLATGEQTGTNVAIDPLEPDRGLDGGAWAMLAASLGLILLGAWLALRWRPLRHREA